MHITPINMATGGHLERFGVAGRQGATTQVVYTGTAANSPPFTEGQVVKIWPDANCWFRIGVEAVAAVNTGEPLDAATGDGYYRYVAAGERISAIVR